ncbi:hypothetical protein TNCV_2544141 [Trichonephila clavipes]|nr:hypothetical protein TNCV_2544141 [Trichonephila clavipes]
MAITALRVWRFCPMVPDHMWNAGTQLDPNRIFSCPAIVALFKIDNCSMDILYSDRAMDVATAVIHVFGNI